MITVPKHIAVIMDGNGRWAEKRGLSRIEGHIEGLNSVKTIIKSCIHAKIEILSLFAFSSENWLRPDKEVSGLMALFAQSLQDHVKELHEKGVRLQFIGDKKKLDPKLCKAMQEAQDITALNKNLLINIGINYGGRWDILNAFKNIYAAIAKDDINISEITIENFSSFLSTKDCPEPDLLIRTGGEKRISNFFLWQLAYTELYFSDVYWPDFNDQCLNEAILYFNSRNRRFGAI